MRCSLCGVVVEIMGLPAIPVCDVCAAQVVVFRRPTLE